VCESNNNLNRESKMPFFKNYIKPLKKILYIGDKKNNNILLLKGAIFLE